MALYDYKSIDGKIITISRSMKQKKPNKITRKGVVYFRVWHVPQMAIDLNKPKTVGSLADKNTEHMLRNGDPSVKTRKERRPWWRDSDKPLKNLNKLTKKQKINYMKTGKI